MKTYAVYFKPRGALATWPLASDTLFGAVCWGIRILGLMDDQTLTDWLKSQLKAPRFAFSHAFPVYFNRGKVIRLYPRPANFYPSLENLDKLANELQNENKLLPKLSRIQAAKVVKEFKKVDYVSESVLTQLLSGHLTSIKVLKTLAQQANSYFIRSGALGFSKSDSQLPHRLFQRVSVQHNHIDRLRGTTVEGLLFYREEIYFAPGAGLWAILKAEENEVEKYIRPSLNYLSDTGLGADRTSGKGHFEIRLESFELPTQISTQMSMMVLSHYVPQADEVDLQAKNQAYILKTLRPRREKQFPRSPSLSQRSEPIYKQTLHVFEPGSVFAVQKQKEIYGQVVRLTPESDEPVYQSGATVALPMVALSIEETKDER